MIYLKTFACSTWKSPRGGWIGDDANQCTIKKMMMQRYENVTRDYSNDNWEQEISVMKVEQEARESKPNANTKNFSEVRAPSSTSPPSPEGFLTTISSQRCLQI